MQRTLKSLGIISLLALLLAFDGAAIPTHRSAVVNWSAPDNRSVDAFARTPLPAHASQTFFNLVHSLHETRIDRRKAAEHARKSRIDRADGPLDQAGVGLVRGLEEVPTPLGRL